jgi:hypothetical protein
MAKLLKLRRGTTTQHGSFTGAEGEVTVDTDKETLVVHDGSTAGGHPVAAEDMANVSSASIAGRLANDSIATSKIAAGALPSDVTVASANIVDGTIVNADVNASAAIAGTKISPDFGSQNITTDGDVNLPDGSKIQFGASNDLQIFHDGNHSRIKDTGTGDMVFHANTMAFRDAADGENIARFNENGDCQLFHDNTLRLQTTSSGVDVTGRVTADDLTVENSAGNLSAFFTSGNGLGTLEVGGTTGAFIDLKTPASDDFDLRVDASGTLTSVAGIALNTASGSAVSVQRNLDVGAGVDVTGNITVTGTVDGRDVASDGSKLDGIESGATGDQTSAEIKSLLASNNLTSAHLGVDSVTSSELANSAVDTNAIQNDAVTADKLFNCPQNHILGRSGGGTANVETLTATQIRSILNVENGATADQSASEIVSLVNGQTITPAHLHVGSGRIGYDSNDYIAFSNNAHMDVVVNGSTEFRFESDGDFHADGDVYAFSTTVSSDENLKKDITIVSDAVTKVEALKGVTFKWKKNDADSAGVIAQDVEKVLPEVVKTVNDMEGNEFKAVNYAGLTSILIEAVKDLSARIKVLEAK